MELIRGLHGLRPRHRGCVATIGNFDGLHLGHQVVLRQLRSRAKREGLPATVIVFEPQPQEFFAPERAPVRLMRLREKFEAIACCGIDRLLCLRFDERLASLSAQEFIRRLLVDGLRVRYLVVGDDFRFGRGRSGDFAMLRTAGEAFGFDVDRAETCRVDGERVSSTRVRDALARGDLAFAARLLGRPYAISGRVARGQCRGREMGFPTLNLTLHRSVPPLRGIFAAMVHGMDGGPHPGVAYVGERPIIDDHTPVLEVHLFDFERDCYGQHVRVDLITKIRDDKHFVSFDDLREQIAVDTEQARAILAGA